jgi:RNA polymerase sigma factor (sigma-70 family)
MDPAPTIALSTQTYQRMLDTFQRPLLQFVRGLVGSDEEVYDILQDVFVDAWRAVKCEAFPFTTQGDDRAIRNWLYHAAYCNAVSVLRHRSVIAWESFDVPDVAESIERRQTLAAVPFEERVGEAEAVRAALAKLEPADVACLRLRVVEDFTSVEIARVLDITPDAARKRLSRAMQRLRAAYFAHEAPAQARAGAETPMNEQNHFRQPAPQPLCAALEPLLPLLSLGKLEPDETAHVREHVATCTFCQRQLVEFDTVRDALRRFDTTPDGAAPEMLVSLEAILDAADGEGGEDDGDDQAEVPLPHARSGSTLRPVPDVAQRRGQARLSALGALAAVLLLAVLATAIFRWLRPSSAGITVAGVGTLAQFHLPTAGSQPRFIVAGRDGNVWFTENTRIGRITPQGVITEFPLPAGVSLSQLAAGPDGTIWFTDTGGKIGRLSLRNGSVTEFPLPTRNESPNPIILGPDGNLWFGAGNFSGFAATSGVQPEIGQVTPAGTITEFRLPAGTPAPQSLAAGPDGALWFTTFSGSGNDMIGRISTTGQIRLFPDPTLNDEPGAIVAGPDGNLWFTAYGGNGSSRSTTSWGTIARITLQGIVTAFPLPNKPDPASNPPTSLTTGPDGNLWFVVGDEHTLGRITPQGVITEFPMPPGVTLGGIITLSPDGALWFMDTAANTIDRLELHR